MRWLYHIVRRDEPVGDPYTPASLAGEGFVHCSYAPAVVESARLHLAHVPPEALVALQVDPRRLPARLEVAATPRGPMPHVHGPIPVDAVRGRFPLDGMASAPDRVTGTRVAIVAFEGMTLLDLVGVHDPLARVAAMGFDPTWTTEVVGLGRAPTVWARDGAALSVPRLRPDLAGYDVLVLPGGPGAQALEADVDALAWLRGFPENRLHASVCTGALLLAAAGRLVGVPVTTHASALERLAAQGLEVRRARVVDAGQRVTAAGVTAAIDLGLHLVQRLAGAEVARRIAQQMEYAEPGG